MNRILPLFKRKPALRGQLLKVQFQFHQGAECAPHAPEMPFERQCGLKRILHGFGDLGLLFIGFRVRV